MAEERLDAALRDAKDPQSDLVAQKMLAKLRSALFGVEQASVRVGRFVVLETLGAGAAGIVYAAYDPKLERKLALKVLRGEGSLGRERVLAEARALARLRHPNVLTVHDVGEFEGGVYLATELVEGADLRTWISAEQRDWQAILRAFVEAGRGLLAVHEAGLVHRDFKPANVLVGSDGRVRIADFGLASRDPSAEMKVAGTPAYMAPEQLFGRGIDARADQFGFCLSLHEALFGPVRSEPGTDAEARFEGIREQTRSGPAKPGVGRLPARLRRTLLRGLSRDADGRFPSMAELLSELEDIPRARRRTLRRSALLLPIVVAVLVLRFTEAPTLPEDPCADAAGEMQDLWTETQQEQLREALVSSETPYARDTWAKVAQAIDDYAARWSVRRKQVCEATYRRHEQSGELMDLRVACLTRRAEAFAATLELLKSDPDKAIDAVARLPKLEFCDNTRALQSVVQPPEDPQVRAAVDSVRLRLADAQALLHLGRYASARELTSGLRVEAAGLDYLPLVAEAELMLGQIDWYGGQPDDAVQALRRALWAAESTRHEEVAVAAATALVGVVGADLKQTERAGDWTEHARAINRRLGIPDGWSPELAGLAASNLMSGLELDEAMAIAELGLARATQLRDRILLLGVVGNIHRARGEHEAAVARNREVVDAVRSLYGPAHPSVAKADNNLGNALADAGHRSEAIDAYREAVDIWTVVGSEDWVSAHLRGNLGSALSDDGRYAEALVYERQALDILAAEAPSLDLALRHSNLANSLIRIGELDEAREHFEAAIGIFEEQGAGDSAELSYPLFGLGMSYMQEGRFAAAVPVFERAYEILRGSEGVELVRNITFSYGRALVESGKDRRRGIELVSEALDSSGEPPGEFDRAEIEQWLAEIGVR